MKCVVCSKKLSKGKRKYCSHACEVRAWKLSNREKYLEGKRKYRQKNKEKVNTYNRKSRAISIGGRFASGSLRLAVMVDMPVCQRCLSPNDLNVCHIKPHVLGGVNARYNFIVLCIKCHKDFDKALLSFWKSATRGTTEVA